MFLLDKPSPWASIISNARPRSTILPIPFALDNRFSLRWLLCELNRLVLCIRPDEVTPLKHSIIQNENIDEVVVPNPDLFIQYVADTYHDTCSLDGKNTHHGLGTIAIATTKNGVNDPVCNRMSIPREKLKHANEVIKDKPIEQYHLYPCFCLICIET